jgi:ankyrin repeat protein
MYPTVGPALPGDRSIATATNLRKYPSLLADTALHLAVRDGDTNRTSLLLKNSCIDLESLDSTGETALFIAAKDGRVDIAQLLIDHGANVDAKSIKRFGRIYAGLYTVLQIASELGHRDIVHLLLERGADVNHHIDGDDTTALWYAIHGANLDIVHLLLGWGANPTVRATENWTALHQVAGTASFLSRPGPWTGLMTLLIEQHGADVHAVTTDGRSVLDFAVMGGGVEPVKLMLKHGANFHTPPLLHKAAWRGYLELMCLFLENGADVEQFNDRGDTALHSAVEGADRFEVVHLLLKYGANPNTCTKQGGLSALHHCARYRNIKSMCLLLEHGASVAMYAKEKGTPLHSAVTSEMLLSPNAGEIVRLLLLAGADPNACNDDGLSVKQLARMQGDINVLHALGLQPRGFNLKSCFTRDSPPTRGGDVKEQKEHAEQSIRNQAYRLAEYLEGAELSFEDISSAIVQSEDVASEYWTAVHYESIASTLAKRFHLTSDTRYLDFAIELQYIYNATEDAVNMSSLATLLLERYRKVSNSFIDLDQAMQGFHTAMFCSRNGEARYEAACSYADLCLTYKGAIASMRPFKIVNNSIRDIVNPGLPLSYTSIPRMRIVVSNSVAAAMEARYFDYGLEWFEHSRCVVWSYIHRNRMPFNEVRSIAPDLADKRDVIATQLSTMAEMILDGNMRHPAYVQSVTGYGILVEAHEQLISEVRKLSGFGKFLCPKTLVELRSATIFGPIIIINVAERRSDALILQEGCDEILHVPLPNAQRQSLTHLSSTVMSLLRGSEVEVRKGVLVKDEAEMDETLHLLWTSVVEPVFKRLGLINSPQGAKTKLPRVTWCLSGPLAFLPLHAAGIYKSGDLSSHAAFKYAVHSYTPSLTALVEALQKQKTMPKVEELPTILAVSQPATPKQSPLPETVTEVRAIKKVVGEKLRWLNDSEATTASVLPLIDQHPWIHFACHAIQDSAEATQSGFMLYDGSITLRQLMRRTEGSGRKALAVLSACQTATGNTDMPEEAVHLAAGMLMTGFQSVIATMWSIRDSDAPIVMESFYSYLWHKAKGNNAQSAYALHYAVEQLRKKVGENNFLRWTPFMHLGVW